ncbi:hypothetical protein ACFL67_04300, partial [candidate division KSB1 bacterium]
QQIITEMGQSSGDLLQLSEKQEALRQESADLTVNSDKFRNVADKQYQLKTGLQRTIMRLVKLSEQTFFLTPELGQQLGRSMQLMERTITNLEERNQTATMTNQQRVMESLNGALLSLRESMNSAQQSGTGMGFEEFMQQMENMSGEQQGINQQTQQMPMGGQGMTMEQQAAMQRLAQQQEILRKSLEELMGEMEGTGSMQDRLGQMNSDMNEVRKQLEDKNVTDRTLQLQERILSRMLDAQRSINKRDFSKKRISETGNQYEAFDPGQLPENLGETRQLLQESLLRALKEGYNRDFEELIRSYFENLNKKRIIKNEEIKQD